MDLHGAALHIYTPLHTIKDKKLWLRPKISGITQSRALQVSFSTLCNRAWVTVVTLSIRRLDYITCNDQGGLFIKWVYIGSRWIWHE